MELTGTLPNLQAQYENTVTKKGPEGLKHRLRCWIDARYRRAYRGLRHLPRIEYDFVIDGGASRGSFSDAFLQVWRPQRLVLVEAIPDLAARLRDRYADLRGVSVVAAALSDKSGKAEFEVNEFDYSSSLLRIDPRNSEFFGRSLKVERAIEVPTVTLADLLQREQLPRVDLLKLDLQGAERLVLTGSEDVLGRVRVVFTEVLFEQLYEGCWTFRQMDEYLTGHGFKLCGLSNVVHAVTNGDLLQANATFRRLDAGA